MSTKDSLQKNDIHHAISGINDYWHNKQYDKIGDFLAEEIVMFVPGGDRQCFSREDYIQSYRDYDQAAATKEFSRAEPRIDIFGDSAVAVCPFYVEYEMKNKIYKENGKDILIFSQVKSEWKLVWRTMQVEPIK